MDRRPGAADGLDRRAQIGGPAIRSPCVDCVIHMRKLDKLNPVYPCEECSPRLIYADSVLGMPARETDEDAFKLHCDGIKMFHLFKDGLRIID